MLIVPLAGDSIKTSSGLPGKVLGFTNSVQDGPSVLLDDDSKVPFTEIRTLNGIPVRSVKNAKAYKVLETDGFIDRAVQLPQPGDSVRANNSGISDESAREYEIVRMKLSVLNRESEGILFDSFQPGSEELIEEIRLSDIEDIDHSIFNRKKFLELYSEYAGTSARYSGTVSKGQVGGSGTAGSSSLSQDEMKEGAA